MGWFKRRSTVSEFAEFNEQSIEYEAPDSLSYVSSDEPRGTSPSGTMKITLIRDCSLNNDGSKVPALQIRYDIPDGQQKTFHGNPGAPFQGTKRVAYLPFNKEGKDLLDRFVYAFEHGLIFSVGTSLTTGKSDTVIWPQIPHKTSLKGGPHGYPDHGYLQKANGVLDSLHVPEAEKCRHLRAAAKSAELAGKKSTPATILPRAVVVPTVAAVAVPHTHVPTIVPPSVVLDFVKEEAFYEAPESLPDLASSHGPWGKSPSGTMRTKLLKDCPLNNDGSNVAALQIRYDIPGGQQKSYHCYPGTPFHGTSRVAYLPFTVEGKDLLDRFVYAFQHGLIFTVGTSLSTGKSNTVIWPQIPHKTSLKGGRFGYPDDGYVQRANGVLDSLHVPAAENCRQLRAATKSAKLAAEESTPAALPPREVVVPSEAALSQNGPSIVMSVIPTPLALDRNVVPTVVPLERDVPADVPTTISSRTPSTNVNVDGSSSESQRLHHPKMHLEQEDKRLEGLESNGLEKERLNFEMKSEKQEEHVRSDEWGLKHKLTASQMEKMKTEIEINEIERKTKLLLARHQLRESGVPQSEIDILLPLVKA